MPARRWISFIFVALLLSPAAAHGQTSEIDKAYSRANELYAQGRYEEAIPFAEQALRLGEHEFSPHHPNTAALLNNLAGLYRAQGKYAEAEPLYERSLAVYETAVPPVYSFRRRNP